MTKTGILLIAGLLYSAIVFPQFRIEGNFEKGNKSKVYLITGQDTLAKANLKRGKFILKGKVKEPTVAFLRINKQNYSTPLFLENAGFKIQVAQDTRTLQVSKGGNLQKQQQEYEDAFQENNQKIQEYKVKLKEAKKKQNLFAVMMCRAKFITLDSVRNEIENQFIARYPNSLVSLYHFYKGLKSLNYTELEIKYKLLGEEAKQTPWGKIITNTYLNWNKVAVGQIAPDFTLNTLDGKPMSLHTIQAKVKLLDFWASWCGPCRAENPELVKLYDKYKEQGFEIVSVSLDTKVHAWKKAIEADGLPWIHLSSLQGWLCPVASLYRINSVPSCFVLDADNRIVAVKVWDKALEKVIKETLLKYTGK